MYFWQHNGDLSKPPQFSDLVRRRPWKNYWESTAIDINGAMETFYRKYKREVRDPGSIPYRPASKCADANIPAIRSRVPKRGAGQTKDKPR